MSTLYCFGADDINLNGLTIDPTTEEEFNTITYTSPTPITWTQFQQQFQDYIRHTRGIQLREYRDKQLSETDWVMTVDNYNSILNKEEWTQYRQQLRDLPQNPLELVFDMCSGLLIFDKMAVPIRPKLLRTSQ